jgi:PDZ domain
MRFTALVPAAIFALSAANAQTPAPRSDSGCVTSPNGRVECSFTRIMRAPDSVWRVHMAHMDSMIAKRAALGLELRPTGTKRDTLGVFVENVVPRGPAETAGIVEGDRIAAINGVDLRSSSADVDDPYTNGLAAHRLSREVEKLTPGSKVTLRVYSGGRFHDVTVTAGRAIDLHRGMGMEFGMPEMMMHFHGSDGPMMQMHGPDGPMMQMRGPGVIRMQRPDGPGSFDIRVPRPDGDERKVEIRGAPTTGAALRARALESAVRARAASPRMTRIIRV